MSDFVIDAREFEPKERPKPSGCRNCGAPIVGRDQEAKRHCCRAHGKKAHRLREAGELSYADYVDGVCPVCATTFALTRTGPSVFCSSRCRQRWRERSRAFEAFRARVEWPQTARVAREEAREERGDLAGRSPFGSGGARAR